MEPVTIPFPKPVEWHKSLVKEITIKPPSPSLYLKLGEPRIVVRNSDGAAYYVDKEETIRSYIEDMIDHDGGIDLVNMTDLVTAKRVKGAVLSFFDKADAIVFAPTSASSSST